MHFCVFATRLYGGFSVPRKYGLNWFMPALAKSSVGSSCGTTGLDGTNVCPCFLQKKSMNCWRISLDDGMASSVGPACRAGPPNSVPPGRRDLPRPQGIDTDWRPKFKGPAVRA